MVTGRGTGVAYVFTAGCSGAGVAQTAKQQSREHICKQCEAVELWSRETELEIRRIGRCDASAQADRQPGVGCVL